MFETKLEPLDLGEAAQLAGMDPFTIRDRLLIRAWKGRCCFDVGEAVKCFETTIEIKQGEHKDLELSAAQILGLSLTTGYEFERKITYNCGPCDSVAPVLVYDDAYIHVWEVRVGLLLGSWRRNETVFIPTKRPYIASNREMNDPECGCESAEPPTAGPDDLISLAVSDALTRILQTTTLAPPPPAEEVPDPVSVPKQTLLAVEEALRPLQTSRPEQVGIVDMHGEVTWFTGHAGDNGLPKMVLLSVDCNASVRGRVAVLGEEGNFSILAVSPTDKATQGRLRLSVNEGGRLVEYDEAEVHVASDAVSTAWASPSVEGFGGGVSGQIELELFDQGGHAVVQPLVEEFVIVTTPSLSGTTRCAVEPVQ